MASFSISQPAPPPLLPSHSNRTSPQPSDINEWCAAVPHPEPCKFFMGRKPPLYRPKRESDFLRMTVEVALQRAVAAQSHAWRWGKHCTTHKERAAWFDCVKLYDYTIIQLNRTLHGLNMINVSCTNLDIQTWLSTALTNLETCGISANDLNVTYFILPHVSYNVSDLISNSLAVNDGNIQNKNFYDHHKESSFPSWVGREERRLLMSRSLAAKTATFVVAKDGSGQYETVQAAIDAAARSGVSGRKVIFVKRGVYRENIWVNPYDVMLVGEGSRLTIITGSRSVKSGYTTYNSATAGIDGLRFIARGITFQNTAGPQSAQAVALRSGSDLSVFYQCAFYGYQDTLYIHSQRQFYRECYIFGTIDIIFGNAAVVLQKCMIYARKPIWGQANVITAQARSDPNQNTGIVIHNSWILPAPDLRPTVRLVATYLGRPWQPYSRTVVMKSYLGDLVSPTGWLQWDSTSSLNTLYYAEYRNFGPGSSVRRRVKWRGFHVIKSATVASSFTVDRFIAGRTWLPSTGVPFTSGI
ncbi:hypothetical protein Ancab_008834 [Ancistrocladus abbreviatus]